MDKSIAQHHALFMITKFEDNLIIELTTHG